MDYFILTLELIGAAAFAISGAMTGIRKNMDIFGACVLGLTVAVGGGVMRDIILGSFPPAVFVGAVLIVAIRLLASHYRWSLPKPGSRE